MTDELVPSPPKLPLSGMNDKDQIIDGNGNIFEYDAEHDVWIYRGQIESPDLVTRDFDGLVYPSLYRRLLLIQELIDRGIDFGLFKLDTPGTIPYYYFFYSSDDLIRFYPQPNGKLRLELDRNRLYQKLLRSCCPGPKGQKGYQGTAGRDGVAASKEVYKYPKKASQGEFEFESAVNLPIDTAVSLRLFRGDTILVEYLIDVLHPDSSDYLTITIYDDTIEISTTNTEINFDKENSKVWGILSFTGGADDISQWRYKIRQRGPKGNGGEDGLPFISVSEQMLSDSSAKCGSMINSIRNSNLTNNIFTLSTQIPPDVCVSNLSISASSLPVGDTISARFAAAKVTTKKCKDIGYYQYGIPEYTPPDLELPSWEPTPDCVSAARYNSYKFEWWDLTDPKYPFRIIKPPRPNEQCCQEPMFWCPNVGDNPCGVNHWRCGELEKLPSGAANANGLACNGEAREPILKAPDPYPPECDCDCDSPIAFDLQNGGMALKPMMLNQSNLTQSDIQYSVIDGRTDTYKLNIKSTGTTQVSIQLEWKREICGGNQEKNNCQYQDNCQVHTTIIFEDNSKNAEISNGGASELSEIPSNITFTVKPLSGSEIDVNLNIMVNDTRSQCCRGYLVRIMAQGSPSQLLSQASADVEVVDINWGK